ncbi:LysR family transcriptional regulator [Pseudomonas sp. NA-150]|uniref:LysR family transcriptional regulator n=1 Tax=Pseudomonas sp. NA-150 TaxID=3367525 RepID=UPI0037C672D9
MNKLELLKTFIRVTELSSFTQAGESLGLPRSTVSEQVQALEALLGARLLHRTTRKVQVTQDGLVLYERSKNLLSHMDELEGLFRQTGAVLAGRLRVDMPSILARKVFMPQLPEFIARHPQIELEISSTDRRVDLVREGFDCVLRVGAQPDQSIVARPIGQVRMINCVSAGYVREYGIPQTLEDLATHRLVHYVSVLGSRSEGFEYQLNGKHRQVAMVGGITVNNVECYSAACAAGLGIVQVPHMGARDLLASGEWISVLPDHVPAPMEVSLLYAQQQHMPERLRVFMQWLEALFQAYAQEA